MYDEKKVMEPVCAQNGPVKELQPSLLPSSVAVYVPAVLRAPCFSFDGISASFLPG